MDSKTIIEFLNKTTYPLFSQWLIGTTMDEALKHSIELNKHGAHIILDYLGEKQDNPELVDKTVQEYLRLIEQIFQKKVNADITFKISQLGYEISSKGPEICENNIIAILTAAQRYKINAWIDMESWPYVDFTVNLYKRLLNKFDNIGLCLQANAKRSESDLEKIVSESEIKPSLRFVKGTYKVPLDQGWQTREEVDSSFERLIKKAFESGSIRIAIGTHDEKFMKLADTLSKKYDLTYDLEMLKGVRLPLQQELLRKGRKISIYSPYGKSIFAYSIRRTREAKELYPRILNLAFDWIYDSAYGK